MPRYIWLCICLVHWIPGIAQITIWSEDFSSYQDSATVGGNNNTANVALDWVSGGCIACVDSAEDWWEVRAQAMEAHDVNQISFLQSEVIEVSNYSQISFSLDVVRLGDLEGPYFGTDDCADQTNQDFVNVQYRLDGGSWILLTNYLDWCGLYESCSTHTLYGADGENSGDCRASDEDWDSVRVSESGLSGQTLEIRIELINSSDDEFIKIDNIQVQGSLILPIVLRSFSGIPQNSGVQLMWETTMEKDNHYFQIERSSYGFKLWKSVGIKSGSSFSSTPISYTFYDPLPSVGYNFYRLKQVDHNGRFNYSEIIRVLKAAPIKIYPIPASTYINIALPENWESLVFDAQGQRQEIEQTYHREGRQLHTERLANGWYHLIIKNGAQQFSQSFLVQH